MKRQFVNLVTRNWSQGVYSLCRIDPYNHFFYGSAKAAREAADEAAEKKGSFPAMDTLQLPSPSMNFPATVLHMFALFSPHATSEGRVVYASPMGEADLYDADNYAQISLGRLNAPKGLNPMCLSIVHPGAEDHSMYILDRYPGKSAGQCFEVLEPMPMRRKLTRSMPPWRWRLLPPPPFIRQPGYAPSSVTSFTTKVDGKGCSTIYISCDGVGTYSFEAAHPDSSRHLGFKPSEEWSHVGDWKLPFYGGAQYVPEFKLWFGFLPFSPYHLCAVDLSAMDRQGLPTEKLSWQDLNPPEGEVWHPTRFKLAHLGDGKFLIARSFKAEATGELFTVLTGIEMIAGAGDDHSLQMVKHKCARYEFIRDTIEWVL